MTQYVFRCEDLEQLFKTWQGIVAQYAPRGHFDVYDYEQYLFSPLRSTPRVQWFYYTDNAEGIAVRLYDRPFQSTHGNCFADKNGDPWVILRGRELGASDGQCKIHMRTALGQHMWSAYEAPSDQGLTHRVSLFNAGEQGRLEYFENRFHNNAINVAPPSSPPASPQPPITAPTPRPPVPTASKGTLMWGERGLVATFFTDLSADANNQRWKDFLQRIEFGNGGPGLDWTRLTKVWAVVEPSFGVRGFGLPDLVARLEFQDAPPVAILLEAKMGTYAESAVTPAGRSVKGYNSKLNGQIELNHRLALALGSFAGGQLREPEWVQNTAYHQAGGPRYVLDTAVMEKVVSQLCGLEPQRYLHLAITADHSNPFTADRLKPMWPEIFIARDGRNAWETECSRVGWIGWDALKSLAEAWDNPSLFLPTLGLNEHYLDLPPETPTEALESAVPTHWPPNRPQVGVSLVYLPGFDQHSKATAVHLSWNGNSCAVRNYLHPGPKTSPLRPQYQDTLAVLPLILNEKAFGPKRPAYTNTDAWQRIIEETNRDWRL